MKVEKNSLKLLASRAVNKLGDVLYDYGNSSWIASMGSFGQKMLGIYQIVEVVIAIILNPFGGAIADRFRRRKILLWTDGLCALLCVILAFIPSNRLMLYGLILANMLLAVSNAFSSPAYRAYVPEVVKKEKLVSYNSYLETSVQIIKVSSPLLGFLIYHLINRLGEHLDDSERAIVGDFTKDEQETFHLLLERAYYNVVERGDEND